jgi:hypothetical protein
VLQPPLESAVEPTRCQKVNYRAGGFQGWSQHFRDSGGHVVIISSG